MSLRDNLNKHLSLILRSSKASIMILLSDQDGLSIAKISRGPEFDLDSSAITSVASAAFSASEENWNDLNIRDQIIAFSFFEKICLITIKILNTLLTIVHDFNQEWPLNPDVIGSAVFNLTGELDKFFGTGAMSEAEIEAFSNNVRSAIYLAGVGDSIDFASYAREGGPENLIQKISDILDGIQNPQIISRYGLVNTGGLSIDGRDRANFLPIPNEAFLANSIVAFQKMVEQGDSLKIGGIVSYFCISGPNPDNMYGLIIAPSGNLMFADETTGAQSVQPISFVALFPLSYGAIPVFCEVRNMIYSILNVIGTEKLAEKFINVVNGLVAARFET
jgi:hypothetical protein